ncbi:hypothetical_protein [Candidozyma auris]|uniref:mRNA-binding protein RRP12 n=1 Tax=Candidozyma auris TaxID=498019 RepID=UPI000D2BC002|nr:mRNA-binding protein RRP12 [[Candida] auris]QEO22515.1 hypothetical_protein [[Candida] auris]GBL51078.1 hypothetical protein CAJCM15448_33520 [[Candida] auris]
MAESNPEGGQSVEALILDEKLAKIRTQVNSKLDNQKNSALILSAVEENITEQGNEKTSVAYFVSFLSLLESSISEDEIADANVAMAAAYFLDLVIPSTPAALLKQKFAQILSKLAPILTNEEAGAPLLRSAIGALEGLLLAQDHPSWQSSGNVSPKRALIGLLELAFDARPKVRKRAQEAVQKVLSHPPASPSPTHVAAGLCGELALKRLAALLSEAPKSKRAEKNKESNATIIHCLQLITAITSANAWPASHIEKLCDVLLEVSKTSDQFLVSAAFDGFNGLFVSMTNEIDTEKFTRVLDIIFDLKPPVDDAHLAASWLAVVAKGTESFAKVSPELSIQRIQKSFPVIAEFLLSENKNIYTSASQCMIAILSEGLPDMYLLQRSAEYNITPEIYEKVDDMITTIAEYIEKELLTIKYQHATRVILEFLTAAVLKLRSRTNPDFLTILRTVGEWRSNEDMNFPYNREAEDFIAACISSMGPEAVLAELPLNLTGSNDGEPGRAWLLPILRDNVRFASLQYYKQNILPLAAVFEEKVANASNKEAMHIKIFQTIIDQIWSLLPHFCDLPTDLRRAFDNEFAGQLSDLLYSNVKSRVIICHALRLLAESNLVYSKGALSDDPLMIQTFPIKEAEENLKHLSSMANNLVSVLFNVYVNTIAEARGFILETIDMYLQLIPANELKILLEKVFENLHTSIQMDESELQQNQKKDQPPPQSVSMMDLVVAMAKYAPEDSYNGLFNVFVFGVKRENNANIQKRSYRIISKLNESESGRNAIRKFLSDIENVFLQTISSTHTSSRTNRLAALTVIMDMLPVSDLHFIPAILQEIIMSTKDVNEKSREAAFNLLVQMGKKMAEGGIIRNDLIPDFGPDAEPSQASLTEYFTMVSAGLAGQSQHMISATITALSCLMFEFKDQLPQETLIELASTVELFLTHNSREIAKSAIGFVKVEVLSLPEDLVRSNLSEMLTKLMRWSHEHKDHFKSKVKHIVERLIRKFGVEEVEKAMPEEDRKLVANIRKTRNRAKKHKDADEEGAQKQGKKFMSAYEEAIHDSESEDENEDERPTRAGKRNKGGDMYILEDADEPLNLLDRQTLARISSSKPKKFTKKDAKNEQVEMRNGKIVFKEMTDEDPLAKEGSGIDAYLDAVKQAPVRGQKNKLKFKKSKNEDDWSDDEQEEAKPARESTRKTLGKGNRVGKPAKKQKFKARKKL